MWSSKYQKLPYHYTLEALFGTPCKCKCPPRHQKSVYLPPMLKSLLAGWWRCAGEVFVFICLPNLRIISSSGWITLCLLASTILKGTPLIMYLCLLHNWALPHNQST